MGAEAEIVTTVEESEAATGEAALTEKVRDVCPPPVEAATGDATEPFPNNGDDISGEVVIGNTHAGADVVGVLKNSGLEAVADKMKLVGDDNVAAAEEDPKIEEAPVNGDEAGAAPNGDETVNGAVGEENGDAGTADEGTPNAEKRETSKTAMTKVEIRTMEDGIQRSARSHFRR
ncbi:hypothetical protein QJS10_CPA03g01884 [Acorus calamus]|uniref:Uncharacterized protein n=1 Tax=Acorus calamus TaxID=4465 RepID=A0AAV9F749_ACOCL|nr:hypothetical protein QJS10_CPA03g01884 [Acorus calamus]